MMTRLRITLLLAVSTVAFGGTIVVPNISGAGGQSIALGGAASRIQEVIGSGQFPGAIVITGIRLRAAPGKGPISFNYPSLKVTVSTTQTFPNTANGHMLPSLTYANNVGPDAVTVYNAALSGASAGCSAPGPCNFDIAIPFSTPFAFDPTKGRLLVDLVFSAPSGKPTGSLDAIAFSDATTSTIANVSGDPTQTAGKLGTDGIVFGLDTSTPLISAVENAATNLMPALPNSAIAQGAIFILKGSSLGPATISISQAAFQSTTLSGTSVSFTSGGSTVGVPLYYTSDGQVAGLLPSNAPIGKGTITVTYNNQTSPAFPITVVANNLGIFTTDSSGQGPGIVTYGDYSLVSPVKDSACGGPNTTCGAANPGDTLILWATGLGPVSGNDVSGAGLGQNMPSIPLTLWLGGIQAKITYQGRSGCCVGEDQIVFTVPNNTPTGCSVPLVAQINNQVSNTVSMPVAIGSRSCTLSDVALPATSVQQLGPGFKVGLIELDHFANDNGSGYFDQAKFDFVKILGPVPPAIQPFLASYVDNRPTGTCTVLQGGPSPADQLFNDISPLDAGSKFTVSGPNGSMTVTAATGDRPLLSAAGTFLVAGDYTVSGTGGKDVGSFTANINIPVSPVLVTPSSANNLSVTRAKGMTVNWNANGSKGTLELIVSSATDGTFNTSPTVSCKVPASAGTFTIPGYMLLALPPGTFTAFRFQLGDQAPATTSAFSATGIDFGLLQTFIDGTSLFGFTLN
jgi:uncharacterized protein (TIGR03437 family)